jgi:hypothetical protein
MRLARLPVSQTEKLQNFEQTQTITNRIFDKQMSV